MGVGGVCAGGGGVASGPFTDSSADQVQNIDYVD